MKKIIRVAAAVIIQEGKVFSAQRGPGRNLAHLWEFPGGKIEEDESPRQALIREIKEELLIEVEVAPEAFDQVRHDYDFGRVELTTFICRLKDEAPRLSEHVDFRWLSVDELLDVDWAPADLPTVEKIIRDWERVHYD